MVKKKSVIAKTTILRPPIVAVLGHVDHGKTTLLDTIKKTQVAASETGGITQKIGAYQIEVQSSKFKVQSNANKITFIDTPGHEAFAKMRQRGANAADIALLVVAANDGVMPQTIESIKYIKNAKIPMIVVVNKTDLSDSDIDKVKQQLAKNDVLVEDLGGKVLVMPVSAKTGKGIPELLDLILLLSEMENIQGSPCDVLTGIVIEAKMDKKRGNLATVIVKKGSLKTGDIIFAENCKAKIKTMINDKGEIVQNAFPSTPVEIMGWDLLPAVGAEIGLVYKNIQKEAVDKLNYEFSLPPLETEKKLKMILKSDNSGSMEAILACLDKNVEIIKSNTGEINESDVLLAKSSQAVIIGFNIKPNNSVLKLAQLENVRIKTYTIIYKLLEEIADVISILNQPQAQEEDLGKAKILAEFIFDEQKVAGCKVVSGKITKNDKVKVIRDKTEICRGRIKSMRFGKEDIAKAETGKECGMVFDKKLDFKIGDTIIAYKMLDLLS